MKQARVCGFDLVVPDNVADWDAVAGNSPWEKARFDSMLTTLKPGDTLYDIGVEHGWMSVIYGRHVGGDNMVLCEPSPEFWPNIRMGWEMNGLARPKGMWAGFVGGESKLPGDVPDLEDWPKETEGPECHAMAYRSLKHHDWLIPTITVDDLAAMLRTPKALTIDVEGAELDVLTGARETLQEDRPYVWVSIHPDLMERDFGTNADEIQCLMLDLGYNGQLLGIDHEEHWFFWPEKKP